MLQRWLRPCWKWSCSGTPATNRMPENVERVWAAINKDQRLIVWELEADLEIPNTVSQILMRDLGMKCIMAKFISQLLLPEQKEHCASCYDLIQTATNEQDFLKKVITRDELWVYGYDTETKPQSSQWKSPDSPLQRSHSKVAARLRPC